MTITPADRAYLATDAAQRSRIDAVRSARAVLPAKSSVADVLVVAHYIVTGETPAAPQGQRGGRWRRVAGTVARALAAAALWCWPPAYGKAKVYRAGPGCWVAVRPATGFRRRGRAEYPTHDLALSTVAGWSEASLWKPLSARRDRELSGLAITGRAVFDGELARRAEGIRVAGGSVRW